MNPRKLPHLAAAALAAALLVPAPASAGCLAPADVRIDAAGTVGPFWGSDTGQLLYARGVGAGQELIRRGLGELGEPVARVGDSNGFLVGEESELWAAFHGGAINDRGDAAFVASTTVDDDPGTIPDESIPRRGAYVLRGNTTFELGRFGAASPVVDPFSGPVPWGSFFDAVPFGRPDAGLIRAVFSAQLGAPDGRQGIFLWDEFTGDVTPLVLTGQPSPAGGNYTTFGRLRCNEAGDVVFYALTQVSESSPIAAGLFLIERETLPPATVTVTRVVKFGEQGDEVDGLGRFALMQDFDVDGAGGIAFAAMVEAGPAAPSGLFRWDASTFQVTRVLGQGDTTPLGGTYGSFTQAQLRVDDAGGTVFSAPLSAEIGGTGFFAIEPGASEALPLGGAIEPLAVANLGQGRMAYQTAADTRTILPADEDDEGPNDYRVVLGDFRNSATLRKDALVVDVRFRLPPWEDGQADGETELAPAAFLASADRSSPTQVYAANQVARIVEVRFAVPAHVFTFGIGGTPDRPAGTVAINSSAGTVPSLKISKDADVATWRFTHGIGSGTFTVDLTKGVAKLTLTKGNLFLPGPNDRVTFLADLTLRTDNDVATDRTGDAAYFHRSVRPFTTQPGYPNGFRILTDARVVLGGTFFLDTVRVDRKLKVRRGQAAPDALSDKVTIQGTLRLCPGSTPPSTPSLSADVTVGDLVVADLALSRVGRTGSKYSGRAAAGGGTVTLTVDAVKGTFAFTALNVDPLDDLVDADFSPGAAVNGSRARVGGMSLPISISIDRVYGTSIVAAMTRLPGGKTFVR